MSDYGPLAHVVSSATALVAATAAITLSFKGRATWEPWEEDIPKGPERVAGVLAAVAIGCAWLWARRENTPEITKWASILAGATLVFLLVYGYLVAMLTYVSRVALRRGGRVDERKVIGGFRLIPAANKAVKQSGQSVQQYFEGTSYNADLVWTRTSRAIAKLLFVVSYSGLSVCGTVALGLVGILIGLRSGK